MQTYCLFQQKKTKLFCNPTNDIWLFFQDNDNDFKFILRALTALFKIHLPTVSIKFCGFLLCDQIIRYCAILMFCFWFFFLYIDNN
jgi:hypothetical protein